MLLRMVMTAHSVLLMAIRKTTGGGIKTHSKQPVILQRGKAVFTGKEELPRIRISSGYTSVTGTRNTSRSDFYVFEKTPPFIGGVFLCPVPAFNLPHGFHRFCCIQRVCFSICAIWGSDLMPSSLPGSRFPVRAIGTYFLRFPVFGSCAGEDVLPVSPVRRHGG